MDERIAAAVEADRSGPPLKVFFDKWDIPHGGDIPAELEEGLQKSRYVGLVLSPEALSSDWVTLERSTAIHRDPRARQRSLIPLLHRTCELPDMLARLKYIDFRREQDFNEGLDTLVRILRGRPARRGADIDPADIHFREDAALLKQHRRIFDRPAFRVPCILELFLRELLEAIDASAAAINTGSLYSRSGSLLSSFPDKNEYRLPEFKQAFSRITKHLTRLKRAVVEFEAFFLRVNPNYSHHENFYAMVMSFSQGDPSDVRTLIELMDHIDQLRNEILSELNVLLSRCGEETFDSIELTSAILKKGQIGGADRLSPLLGSDHEPSRKVTTHREVRHLGVTDESVVGSVCRSVREKIAAAEENSDGYYEDLVMRGVRAEVFKGLKDDPLAQIHLGSKLTGLPNDNLTMGPYGDEVRYFGVRTFPSGSIVGLFGVWPAKDRDVYAIVIDEKFPEYFGLFLRSFESKGAAELEWTNL